MNQAKYLKHRTSGKLHQIKIDFDNHFKRKVHENKLYITLR